MRSFYHFQIIPDSGLSTVYFFHIEYGTISDVVFRVGGAKVD
jgi:hypothetical protein